jgi:hypothetical protein
MLRLMTLDKKKREFWSDFGFPKMPLKLPSAMSPQHSPGPLELAKAAESAPQTHTVGNLVN